MNLGYKQIKIFICIWKGKVILIFLSTKWKYHKCEEDTNNLHLSVCVTLCWIGKGWRKLYWKSSFITSLVLESGHTRSEEEIDEKKDRWMNEWIVEMNGWIYGWMNGWMDGWMDEWTDGWMNGSYSELIYISPSDSNFVKLCI